MNVSHMPEVSHYLRRKQPRSSLIFKTRKVSSFEQIRQTRLETGLDLEDMNFDSFVVCKRSKNQGAFRQDEPLEEGALLVED